MHATYTFQVRFLRIGYSREAQPLSNLYAAGYTFPPVLNNRVSKDRDGLF